MKKLKLNYWSIMDKQQNKELMSKLRQPIHVDYISKYILHKSIEECKEILVGLVNDGILEESKISKDYYVVKNQNV
jgi:hypothetical protein